MINLFSIDGPLYKLSTRIYQLLVLNFLWVFFSIPVFTIGASTTALFYVTGKIIRDEGFSSLAGAFWSSFKQNFKQATVIWVIIFGIFLIIYTNIVNIHLMEGMAKFILPVQYVILVELVIISIYVFPLLSRYYVSTLDAVKAAFYIGNRHFITTILCLTVFPGIYYLLIWKWYLILFVMGIYSFWITYLIRDRLKKFEETVNQANEKNEEE